MAKLIINFEAAAPEEFNSIEDLMVAKSQLRVIAEGYQELGMEAPEWAINKINSFTREITSRARAQLEGILRSKRARRAALATREELREKLDSEISDLENRLKQ